MSQFDDEDEYESTEPSPRDLRKALEKANREKAKLAEQVAEFHASQRQEAITAAVASKGLNPKIVQFVPKDLDLGGVASWLSENAELFGTPPAKTEEAPKEPQEAAPDLSALQQMNQAQQGSLPLSGDGADVIAQIKAAGSEQEWREVLFKAGIKLA